MTERVDFYVLKSAAAKQRWTFVCRLTEKAYLRDLSVAIVSDTLSDAQALDELLWTFNERSFIPHQLNTGAAVADPSVKINLTLDAASVPGADLLVNLSARLPEGWQRFGRIAEVIDSDEERRRLGRERFKIYRDMKVALETHQLDEAADA